MKEVGPGGWRSGSQAAGDSGPSVAWKKGERGQ